MKWTFPLFLAITLVAPALPASAAQQGLEQQRAYRATQRGQLMPFAELRAHVTAMMGQAEYLGVEFDSASAIYTLKFLRNGSVIWVQVDGRTGHVLGHTGG